MSKGGWFAVALFPTIARAAVAICCRRPRISFSSTGAGTSTADRASVRPEPIRDPGKPALKLIVSTGSWRHATHTMMLEAADVISPQLYDDQFALKVPDMKNEFATIWKNHPQPFIPAFTFLCSVKNHDGQKCSEEIFRAGLSYVAGLSACGPKKSVLSYVLWSQASIAKSTFGAAYLANADRTIPTGCKTP